MKRHFLILILVLSIVGMALPTSSPQPAAAQGGTGGASFLLTNFVLYNFSNYAGVSPVLTASEIELGNPNRPFDASYTVNALDLREVDLSCDSPSLEEGEQIYDGRIGYRYLITLQGRIYEFRVNLAANNLIRCYFGKEIDFDGTPRGIGATISGDQASDLAFAHAQNYLGLDVPINTNKANNPDDDTPYLVYRWDTYLYLDGSLGCPQYGKQYDVRDTFAFRVQLTVGSRYLDYRVRGDGAVALLCIYGRPHSTSIGLGLNQLNPTVEDTEDTTDTSNG